MPIPVLLLLLLLSVPTTLVAVTSDPNLAFHPRVSTREICLNQVVQIGFHTSPQQVEEVDIPGVLRSALQLPRMREDWLVVGTPRITVHEKGKDVEVVIRLLPRRSGELELPAVPVTWLSDAPVIRFGKVTVLELIRLGTDRRPVPPLVSGVSDLVWGASGETVLKTLKTSLTPGKDGRPDTVKLAEGNILELSGGRLAAAVFTLTNLPLQLGRNTLCEAWGDPFLDTLDAAEVAGRKLEWVIGWIRIVATQEGEDVRFRVLHEGITQRVIDDRVRRGLFDRLQPGSQPAAASPAKASGPSEDLIRRTFEKKVESDKTAGEGR